MYDENVALSADEISAALEQATYELSTEVRLARVGLKERQETAPIIARYSGLYTRPRIEALQQEVDTSSGERREEVQRLHNALLSGYVSSRVASLSDEVVSALATATAEVAGESIPFHALVPQISVSADGARRERLHAGLVAVVEQTNPTIARLQSGVDEALADLGYARYYDYCVAVKGVDYPRFASTIAQMLEATQPLYAQHVYPWVATEVGRLPDGQLSNAHTYWLRRNQVPEELFLATRMEGALCETLHGMGLDLDSQSQIHIDAEDRPAKNPRACVMGARIPQEVHLIIKPTGGKGDYDAFFHEAGHAEHFGMTDPSLPFAFRHLSKTMAQAELFSYLMENLINDPEWLQTYLQFTPAQAALVAYRATLSDLILLRRYGAKYLYEYRFFAEGGDGPGLYAELLRQHTGFSYPASLWMYDRDSAFYSADYLRAWFGHAQVRGALRRQYGVRWWADERASAVVQGLWRQGVRPDIEDIVRQVGETPWDVDSLRAYYDERLAYGAEL